MAASVVFAWYSHGFSGATRRLAICTSVGFALYGVAAGAIVPAAELWPASAYNYDWFVHLTGIPIQLVRAMIACGIAISIWAIWGDLLVSEIASERYTTYLHKQFVWTLVALATVVVVGWAFTEFLGWIYQQNVQEEAQSDIDLLASRLTSETFTIDGMVKALAGSPTVPTLLVGGSPRDIERAKLVLVLDVEASGASSTIYWTKPELSSPLPNAGKPRACRISSPPPTFRNPSPERAVISLRSMR
jgi:hypothetical protein